MLVFRKGCLIIGGFLGITRDLCGKSLQSLSVPLIAGLIVIPHVFGEIVVHLHDLNCLGKVRTVLKTTLSKKRPMQLESHGACAHLIEEVFLPH